jgi:acyl-CoA reductase-like NAD-dependent aldehyde dehydrogenase
MLVTIRCHPSARQIRLSTRRRYGKTIRMIPDYQRLIGGEWVDAVSGESFETVDPATGAAWARVSEAGAADVDAAVRAARAALADPAWSDLTPAERGRLLRRLADILRRDAEELAILESTDNGKLLRETRAQCAAIADHIEYTSTCRTCSGSRATWPAAGWRHRWAPAGIRSSMCGGRRRRCWARLPATAIAPTR